MERFKIFTGYFAKARQYESKGLIPISIARYSPRWFSGILRYIDLAPTGDMLKMSDEAYLKKFDKILKSRSPEKVVEDLRNMSGGYPVVLLCYEKPTDFCHRQIVAKWLTEKTGIEVVEYGFTKKETPEKPKEVQKDLLTAYEN